MQIAYFDQLRQQLDDERTVWENIADGGDAVRIGNESRHVIGYLQDFLFSPERARTPVRFLSGGERNRVLLARLFAKPANVIVLDEPTNDLDTETLELLEERLVEFDGTVLLVSHDREFLNNVVTSTIVFEETGVREYDGGYDDWQRQRAAANKLDTSREKAAKPAKTADSPPSPSSANSGGIVKTGKRKMSYKEQQELSRLPTKIEQLEAAIAELHQAMAQADFYKQAGDVIGEQARLQEMETSLANSYARWEELEGMAAT